MGARAFKATATLTVTEGGARLEDSETGRVLPLTELEGRLLELFDGEPVDELARKAQQAGFGLWPETVRAILERAAAGGYLAAPLPPGPPDDRAYLPQDLAPAFRTDLLMSRVAGASGICQVWDPNGALVFSLHEGELTLARLLSGQRTAGELYEAAAKVGLTVTAESLLHCVKHFLAFGFIDTTGAEVASSTWPARQPWSPDARELFQSALRLMRAGHALQAVSYLDTVLELFPDAWEVTELKERAQAMIDGSTEASLSFEALHGAAPVVAPPPPPDDDLPEARPVAPPPSVPKVRGLGLLPVPHTTEPLVATGFAPAPAPLPIIPRSTMVFGMSPMEEAAAPPPLTPSEQNLPSVDAGLASVAPLESVQVDSMAFVPQGQSVELDPAFAAQASDAEAAATTLDAGLKPSGADDEAALAALPELSSPNQQVYPVSPAKGVPVAAPRKRWLMVVAVLATLAIGSLAVPVPRNVEAACALTPLELGQPKVEAEGKISELLVKDGDQVAAGAPLAKVELADAEGAAALAEKEQAARGKAAKLKAASAKTAKAKKAAAALAKAEKELQKAKAAAAKLEGSKKQAAALAKAKKAVAAKQKARDKAQAALDGETQAKQRAALEAEADEAAAARARLLAEAPGTTVVAPAAGRFVAPAKHAVGMGLQAGEGYGRVVDPGIWVVTSHGLPAPTEPSTAKVHLESGRIIDVKGGKLAGDGLTRTLQGTALLTDDAMAAGKPVLKVKAGRRPLAVVLLRLAR